MNIFVSLLALVLTHKDSNLFNQFIDVFGPDHVVKEIDKVLKDLLKIKHSVRARKAKRSNVIRFKGKGPI